MFEELIDKWGNPYFSLVLDDIPIRNASLHEPDISSLLNPALNITSRVSGSFSTDLTSRDDVLLAFISLVLLLVIEGLVTTLLLRTRDGNVSNFGFSAKQIMALVQELNFPAIFHRRRNPDNAAIPLRQRVNVKLMAFTVAILCSTFLLEVAVLFLTAPSQQAVTNKTATFRLRQPVVPDWHDVRYHVGRSIDLACEAFVFEGGPGVLQGETRINGCVRASTSGKAFSLLDTPPTNMTAEITTRLHEYGAQHTVRFVGGDDDGDDEGTFSTRAYFSLSDGETRVMKAQRILDGEARMMEAMHKQLLAYLMSAYKQITNDDTVTLDTMNAIEFESFASADGGKVTVLPVPGEIRNVPSRLYTTRVQRGYLTRGVAALRLAQHSFRGMAAMEVSEAETQDLTIENKFVDREAVVWLEEVRVVNWLSLGLSLACGVAVLVGLRIVLKPMATAEIASVFVKQEVHAEKGRLPLEVASTEKRAFRVVWDETEYLYGAETREGWTAEDVEYKV